MVCPCQQFDAVLFDLDATLLDHVWASQLALLVALADAGTATKTDDGARAYSLWCAIETGHFQAYLDGKITFLEQRRRRAREFLKTFCGRAGLSDDALDAWFGVYRQAYEANWCAFPDVKPCLQYLNSRVRVVAVITNGDAGQQQAKLNAMSLGYLPLFASSQIGVAKPDPLIFQTACQASGVRMSRAIYVGDNAAVDAAGATAAGLRGVWLDRSRPHDLSTQPPRISTLLDLSYFL
jgi:putative hydrolase of the HAD superfamily